MNKYGLTEYDLNVCKEKIKNQKEYLEKNGLVTAHGQFLTLMDLSFSANHSQRYYAQLANKINTMENIALNEGLHANFLTMTLDGFYRDLLKGDYKRFNAFKQAKRDKILKSVPDNDKLGFIRFKMSQEEKLTIKDLYNILNYQMLQFRSSSSFKNLRKNNQKYIYIKTAEPHKDGVPHFHMMLFIPKDFVGSFKKDFKRFFIAPQNSKPQKDGFKKNIPDTLQGFQTDIKSASAYIMKYINKSFLDIKSGKELDYLNAWFIKHRIMRCVTSRSVLPQWVYQKCAIFEKDWGYLTDILNSPDNHSEWNKELNCFWIYDNWSDREIVYQQGQLSIYTSGKLINRSGEVLYKPYIMASEEKTPNTWTKKKYPIPNYYLGKNIPFTKHITQMKDYELQTYHDRFDIENDSYVKYLSIKNLMIDRGLLLDKKYNLDSFDIDQFILFEHS